MEALPPTPPEAATPPSRFAEASRLMAHLHRYQLLLRRHWWIIPACVSLVLLPLTFVTAKQPPSYESKGRMWMAGKLNIAEGKLYSEELTSFMGTQADLMRSRTIFERALAKVKKEHPDWPIASTNYSTGNPYQLEAKEALKSAVIDLRATGPHPEAVRAFLEAIMSEYLAYKKETRDDTSNVTLGSVTEQVNKLRAELAESQVKLQHFQMSNSLVFLQEQGSSAVSLLAGINKKLANLRAEYKLLKLLTPEQLTDIATKPKDAIADEAILGETSARELVQTMAAPQAEYLKACQQIALLEAKKVELSEFMRPAHPMISKLEEDIASQKKLVELFKSQSLDQLDKRAESLSAQIKNLEEQIKEYEQKSLDSSQKMAQYNLLQQDVKRAQDFYDRLLQVVQSVDVNKNIDQESIRIMEHPSAPRRLSQRPKILLLGLMAGLFLGCGALYLVALIDDRFTSIAELRDQLPQLVIGQIPEDTRLKGLKTKEFLSISANGESQGLIESFRNVRSSLLYMFNEPHRPKTILVTSTMPDEGKTTVTANLAVTLAMSGARVLLIDADLRRDSIYQVFGIQSTPGLAEILNQEIPYLKTIVPSKAPNLSIIPAGDFKVNPGELFLNPSVDVFLREIYPSYDFILFDSPPVLATDDASTLAPKLDGVIYVVRGSFTSARMAREGLNVLQQRNANILGLVFNRAVTTMGEYYYYYRYKNYYYRGSKRVRRTPKDAAPKPAGNGEESEATLNPE